MIIGDFNEILDGEEHSNFGTSPSLPIGMRDFQNLVRYCALTDMLFHGPQFTWCNKREEELICKKLDRVLINDAWTVEYPHAYSVFDSGGCSDHLRCRFEINTELIRYRKPFKFTNALATVPEFLPLVESHWRETEQLFNSTSTLFRLSKKLKELKLKLRRLSKDQMGDLSKRTKQAYDSLCECQKKTLSQPSQQVMEEETRAYRKWHHLADLEERFLRQRSKLHWLLVGDGNNRSFHQATKARERQNSIREIERADGTIAETQTDLKREAAGFFHKFLSRNIDNYQGMSEGLLRGLLQFECSENDKEMLIRTVTEEEVKGVLFAMPSNKSPGPDGFTTEFYKETWQIVGKEFVVAIQSFFVHGFLPKGVNSTILALIPKKTDAKGMRDYRPISCCNVLYKVISKILANRLKKVLPKFIAPNQSAFVKDRLLMENVLLASELVKNYHKDSVSSRCAVKIDISKAFDSVQWPFLLSILSALKFPKTYIHWIRLCITTASFSVQVNGELAGYFQSERGIRQGCSLSPYLFVICMHVLSKMLDRSASDRKIGFHPYCQNLNLTHLCFADDLLVFSDGTIRSIEGILEVFKDFAEYSGLTISLEKSTLYLAGISETRRAAILEHFPFSTGSLPVRYLGLPLLTKRMTIQDYTPLLEKIRGKISKWTARYLSFAGRLQLIASVIQSIINFWISAFRLPKACIKEIDRLCAAFLWSGPDLNPRKAKLAWHEVCLPKEEGGLGLRSLSEANKVCCLKLIWRILSAHSLLWVNWIRMYLIREGSFWSIKETSTLGSWIWKKLLKYREMSKSLTKTEVKNGVHTSFWFDNWTPLGRLLQLTRNRGSIDMGIQLHSSLATVLATHRKRRHRVELLNRIEEEIEILRLQGISQETDRILWKAGDKYKLIFNSKETWRLTRVAHPTRHWHKGIWFKHSTPKYSFIAWLATRNRLSTGNRMLTWAVGANVSCLLCPELLESRNHLFFSCPYSSEIWGGLTRKMLGTEYITDWDGIMEVLLDDSRGYLSQFILRYVFQTAIFSIWRERNSRRHGDPPTPSTQLAHQISKQMCNRFTTIRRLGDQIYDKGMELWFSFR